MQLSIYYNIIILKRVVHLIKNKKMSSTCRHDCVTPCTRVLSHFFYIKKKNSRNAKWTGHLKLTNNIVSLILKYTTKFSHKKIFNKIFRLNILTFVDEIFYYIYIYEMIELFKIYEPKRKNYLKFCVYIKKECV
jgi:hypothetical protein